MIVYYAMPKFIWFACSRICFETYMFEHVMNDGDQNLAYDNQM